MISKFEHTHPCLSVNFELSINVTCYWYVQDCPSGELSRNDFTDIYAGFFPKGNAGEFAQMVFQVHIKSCHANDFRLTYYCRHKGAWCPDNPLVPLERISTIHFLDLWPQDETYDRLQVFDINGDGTIEFDEFLTALSITSKGTMEEKLEWVSF